MAVKVRKAKRDNRIVTYVRLQPEHHARITKIVETRGWPHTIASVISEIVAEKFKVAEQ